MDLATLLLTIALVLALIALAGMALWNGALRKHVASKRAELNSEVARHARRERSLKQAHDDLEQRFWDSSASAEQSEKELARLRVELEDAEARLKQFVRVDGLTGVANRALFDSTLTQEINRAIRAKEPLSVIICDIDGFRMYNEMQGAEKGDAALQRIATALQLSSKRAGDLVARFAGAQFGLILPAADEASAVRIAERLRQSVWGLCIPHDGPGEMDRITISTGLVVLQPTRLHEAQQVIELALHAVEKAKTAGANTGARHNVS